MRGEMGRGARSRSVIWFFLIFPVVMLSAQPASAQFYVRSPDVHKGQLALEEHGAFYSGPGEDERRDNTHEIEQKYGLTDRFEVIVEQELEDPKGGDLEAEELVIGGQYEFLERHGDGLGLAFRTLYEFALLGGEPDEILFGPLGKWVHGPDSFTFNTFFIGQVGNDVEIDSLEFKFFWRLKHELNEKWGLGVESYSEIEDLSNAGSFDDQKHRIGPVAYLELPHAEGKPEWEFAGGVLFGISDATSEFTYKFDAEVKF